MRFDGPTRFASLAFAAYLAVAWVVRFDTRDGPHNASLSYPFDTFSMYAEVVPDEASAIVARLADGTTESPTAFASLECVSAVDGGAPLVRDDGTLDEGECHPAAGVNIGYLDANLASWLRSHPGPGPISLELVRRTWATNGGATSTSAHDCVLATCRARR